MAKKQSDKQEAPEIVNNENVPTEEPVVEAIKDEVIEPKKTTKKVVEAPVVGYTALYRVPASGYKAHGARRGVLERRWKVCEFIIPAEETARINKYKELASKGNIPTYQEVVREGIFRG